MWYLQRYFGQIADPFLIATSIVVSRVEQANQSTAITYQLLANADGLSSIDSSGNGGEHREIPPH